MLGSRSYSRYMLWATLCAILLLAIGEFRDVYVAIVRNYVQLRFSHAFRTNEGQAQIVEQVSRVADTMQDDSGLNRLAGMGFLVTGDNERALEHLLRAQIARANDRVTLYWLGKAYERSGDYTNALLAMYQAGNLEYFPSFRADMSSQELADLAQDLAGRPIGAHAHFEVAKLVYSTDAELARKHFELAFQKAPEDLHYSLDAAWFLYNQKDLRAARIFGERARSLFPAQPWVYVFWGTLNRATGDFDQAIRDLEKAIELLPTGNVGNAAHLELSKIYSLREEYDVAIEHLEIANQIQEGQFSVYLQLSRAYAGLQECAVAQEKLVIASSLIETERQRDIYAHFEETVRKDCP
jgi:tetratricopeptide (TPR) repeat protein